MLTPRYIGHSPEATEAETICSRWINRLSTDTTVGGGSTSHRQSTYRPAPAAKSVKMDTGPGNWMTLLWLESSIVAPQSKENVYVIIFFKMTFTNIYCIRIIKTSNVPRLHPPREWWASTFHINLFAMNSLTMRGENLDRSCSRVYVHYTNEF